MKCLLIGSTGQLGQCLIASCPDFIELHAAGRGDVDLSVPTAELESFLDSQSFDLLVNAAAYTAVDQAEIDSVTAYKVNGDAVGCMASYCAKKNVRFIHVSTDFVFDGEQSLPYSPSDEPNPLNAYGASKLAGETLILAAGGRYDIVRTSWVYSHVGRNFVKTMLGLAGQRDELTVVDDQLGTPTSAINLASLIWQLVQVEATKSVLHFSDDGVASWYDFAVAIFEESFALGLIKTKPTVLPVSSCEYVSAAATDRPNYSVLNKSDVYSLLPGFPRQHWRSALRDVLKELNA